MTHVDETFLRMPAHLTLDPGKDAEPGSATEVRLLVRGQGTIAFAIARMEPFSVTIQADIWTSPGFRWDVSFDGVSLSERRDGVWRESPEIGGPGLDLEPGCPYWFSFDVHNRALSYGKGEMRLGTMIAAYCLGPKPEEGPDPYAWLSDASIVKVSAAIRGSADVWRDPVTVDPPMLVVPHDRMTMEDVANGQLTVPANLTPACQLLYDNVAGESFILDTPDFRDFSKAIKASIESPDGWCSKKLAAKADEFGKPDPKATYLRITLGRNQGESPGIPFVMEIWPPDHYSPIHNHGGADAVIRVLHGAIQVSLFPMLSALHQYPFAVKSFATGDVTWISARLNQVHKLENVGTEPCITIQCYMYAETNLTHWPYFDYLANSEVAHFDPNSDADFLDFKKTMQDEWWDRQKKANGPPA